MNYKLRLQTDIFITKYDCITKYQICIDIQSEHNYVILSGVIQRNNYMFRPLYLAIIRLYLAYRVTALHTSVSNGNQDLV